VGQKINYNKSYNLQEFSLLLEDIEKGLENELKKGRKIE
jgi:hypothetical protein